MPKILTMTPIEDDMRNGQFSCKSDLSTLDRIGADFEFKFVSSDAGDGTFEGYASLFGLMDNGGDIVEPGAFKKSLKKRGPAKVKMLFQHDSSQIVGVWDEISEDERGLHVKGHLLLDLAVAKESYVLMKAGALSGMSIGFRTVNADIDRATGARHLKEVDLWEISIVTFPLQPEATVTAVKGETIFSNAREMEQAFRDGGLSAGDAKIAVSITKKMVQRDAGRPGQPNCEGMGELLLSIRKASEALRQ